MNKKIIGILVMMLLIATALSAIPVTGKCAQKPVNIERSQDNNKVESCINSDPCDYIPGTYILETKWHQSGLYAMKTPLEDPFGDPEDPDNHWRLGCWSTAIGQIINFHQLQSYGHAHYICTGAFDKNNDPIVIDNNLDDHTYNWNLMPGKLYSSSSQEEIDSVSTFLYDVSTVIQKDFGTGTYVLSHSGRAGALKNHFERLDSGTNIVSNPSISNVQSEIDNYHPCMLHLRNTAKTSYHAVVIDGYEWKSNEFYVHLNMGWGGSSDGWYNYNQPIGNFDDTGYRKVMYIKLQNYKPYIPSDPYPEDGSYSIPIDINLSWSGGDPDPGDTVTYDVYFGTNSPPPKVVSDHPSTAYNPESLDYLACYYWQIISHDNHDNIREGPIWYFTTRIDPDNVPPDTPDIDGPTSGSAGTDYTYILVTTDQNVDNVSYYIDWGDGTNSGWTTYSESGGNVELTHKWDEQNTYTIKAKARDVYFVESDWATLEVSMPKNKAINTPFLRSLENHPRLFPLLRHLMGV